MIELGEFWHFLDTFDCIERVFSRKCGWTATQSTQLHLFCSLQSQLHDVCRHLKVHQTCPFLSFMSNISFFLSKSCQNLSSSVPSLQAKNLTITNMTVTTWDYFSMSSSSKQVLTWSNKVEIFWMILWKNDFVKLPVP